MFYLAFLGLVDAPREDMPPEIHGVDQTRFAAHAGWISCCTLARELCNDLLDAFLPLGLALFFRASPHRISWEHGKTSQGFVR